MERVHKLALFLTVMLAFLSLVASSDCRRPNLGNKRAKVFDAVADKLPTEPMVDVKSPREGIFDYTDDSSGLLTDMEKYDSSMSVDGVNGALFDGYSQDYYTPPYGYSQGYYRPPYGYRYPFPGDMFGFPRGRFGFPRGIFGFPGSIFGLPGGLDGFPGFTGSIGGFPGGYGGNPGGYGLGGPGGEPGIGESGGRAEAKDKKVYSP